MMVKRVLGMLLILVLMACGGGDDGPQAPAVPLLVFPEQDSECTTGISLNEESSEVEFRWQAASGAVSYELRVTNLFTNIAQSVSTANLTANLPIAKGQPFSWQVVAKGEASSGLSSNSAVWRFYNAGSTSSYAPFPPDLRSPKSGATVLKDLNNEVELIWAGGDVDGDLEGYKVYFSEAVQPTTLVADLQVLQESRHKVSVQSNTVYYWQVEAVDAEGNVAKSDIYQFKVY